MLDPTRPGEEPAEPPPGAWRWVVLGASAPLFACSQFFRVANAIVAPQLQRELGLSSEALGSLSASFFYAFAAAQIPLALVLDRVGARVMMAALSLVGAAGAVVFATADGRVGATLGEVLVGVGMAANLMGSMKLVGHWFSRREFATVAGAIGAFGTLGNLAATTPLAVLVARSGWRHAFATIAAVTAVLAVAFYALVRERPPAASPSGGTVAPERIDLRATARRLLSTREYWLISLAAFCRYGSYVSIVGLWAGPYLLEVAKVSPLRAANLLLLANVSFVVGAPLGGWLSDRVLSSRKKVVLAGLAGLAAAELALALAGPAPSLLLVAGALATLGVASSFAQVVYAHMKDLVPDRMAGMAMTGVNFFTMLGAAAFVHGTGWILDRGAVVGGSRGPEGYRAAFLASSLVVAGALAAYALTRDPRPPARARRSDASSTRRSRRGRSPGRATTPSG